MHTLLRVSSPFAIPWFPMRKSTMPTVLTSSPAQTSPVQKPFQSPLTQKNSTSSLNPHQLALPQPLPPTLPSTNILSTSQAPSASSLNRSSLNISGGISIRFSNSSHFSPASFGSRCVALSCSEYEAERTIGPVLQRRHMVRVRKRAIRSSRAAVQVLTKVVKEEDGRANQPGACQIHRAVALAEAERGGVCEIRREI
jgi:hypothetical protein